MPQSVDAALQPMPVVVRLVVLAQTSVNEVVRDDLTQLLALVMREPPVCQTIDKP